MPPSDIRLPVIPESVATGPTARIYDEIRDYFELGEAAQQAK